MREAVRAFLAHSGWGNAMVTPVAGDLSQRRYFRLSDADRSAVLMDADQIRDSIQPFVSMTQWLRKLGLAAPELLAEDRGHGLLLLEDLGTNSVSGLLADGSDGHRALDVAVELLLVIRGANPPELPQPSARELCDWTLLADSYYPGASIAALDRIRSKLETVLTPLCTVSATVSLRDFHADNLMWLPERDGVARLGLLDYQDAILAHPVYDLVSLLTDARTDISCDIRTRYIREYVLASGDDFEALNTAFAAFSVQRNLRILGIFHRAAIELGKPQHLPKVPRVYRYLAEALEHPAFSSVQSDLAAALPPPGPVE